MVGGLVQIATYGSEDIFLTGNPQITYFKFAYLRHTNFGRQILIDDFEGTPNFNGVLRYAFKNYGDLLSKLTLKVTLPRVALLNESTEYADDEDINDAFDNKEYAYTYYVNYNKYVNYMMGTYNLAYVYLTSDEPDLSAFETNFHEYIESQNASELSYENLTTELEDDGILGEFSESYTNLINTTNMSSEIQDILDNYELSEEEKISSIFKTINQIKHVLQRFQKSIYNVYVSYTALYDDLRNQYVKFAWVCKIGFYIIKHMKLYIGGQLIEEFGGKTMDIIHQLMRTLYHDDNFNKMIGDIPELTTYDKTIKDEYVLYVPLPFFFCMHTANALPLISLTNNDIYIEIDMENLENVVLCNYPNTSNDLVDKIKLRNIQLLCEYYFLDEPERKRFGSSYHEYLICLNREYDYPITNRKMMIELEMNNPSKELIFYFELQSRVNNGLYGHYGKDLYIDDGTTNDVVYDLENDYGKKARTNGQILEQARLMVEKDNRYRFHDGTFYNCTMTTKHHMRTPLPGVYNMPFSLHPENYQPSGSMNLSMLSNFKLDVEINSAFWSSLDADDVVTLRIINREINVLRVASGYGSLAF